MEYVELCDLQIIMLYENLRCRSRLYLCKGQKGINTVAGTHSNHPLNDKSKESPVNPQPPIEVKQVPEKPPEKPLEKVPDKASGS